jgi:hypothetical protein
VGGDQGLDDLDAFAARFKAKLEGTGTGEE